jgi:hypothetical protein
VLSLCLAGLASVLPGNLLHLLTWSDLEHRVCGRPIIDIGNLRRHTQYDSRINPDAPHIRYFWRILQSFNNEERCRFVRFAWGQVSGLSVSVCVSVCAACSCPASPVAPTAVPMCPCACTLSL